MVLSAIFFLADIRTSAVAQEDSDDLDLTLSDVGGRSARGADQLTGWRVGQQNMNLNGGARGIGKTGRRTVRVNGGHVDQRTLESPVGRVIVDLV